MLSKRGFAGLALAACMTLAGGCAPAATTAGDEPAATELRQGEALVRVENSLIPPTAVTVYAVETTGGTRRLLGSVSPNRTESFRLRMPLSTSTYRLVARTTGGSEVVSTPITITEGDTLSWDMQINALRVM